MVGLLHAMAFMVLLLIGWVIWNNKPLPLPLPLHNKVIGYHDLSSKNCEISLKAQYLYSTADINIIVFVKNKPLNKLWHAHHFLSSRFGFAWRLSWITEQQAVCHQVFKSSILKVFSCTPLKNIKCFCVIKQLCLQKCVWYLEAKLNILLCMISCTWKLQYLLQCRTNFSTCMFHKYMHFFISLHIIRFCLMQI